MTEGMIVSILFYLGLTALFVSSEPMILLKRYLGFKEEEIGKGKDKSHDFITKLIYCTWCSSIYITFFISFDFQLAVIVSFFFYIINKFN